MPQNLLTITADREEYATGLSGCLQVEAFSGCGEGWFNNTDIDRFCKELIGLAKNMEGTVELIGSEQKADGSQYLETFTLRLYVLSASKLNGIIGIHCTLADYDGTDCRIEEIRKMSGEVQVRNQHITTLAGDIQKLINGVIDEVKIVGDLGIF